MARTQGRVVYTGRRFRVEQVPALRRDGTTAEREVVVHPGSAVILAVDGAGQLVLLRNERVSVGRALWELPAGTLEAGEEPAHCAARELEEESGYRAQKVEPLCGFYPSPGVLDEKMHCFLATGLEFVGQRLEPGETITVELVSPERALELVRSGEVEDGKTLAALLYWWTFRR